MANHTQRREFLTFLVGGGVAWPLVGRAQQAERTHRVGMLLANEADDPETGRLILAFKKGLLDLGWTEGRNIELDYHWATANPERVRPHADELLRTRPSLIFVNSTPGARIVQRETTTIPLLFVNIADPIGSGLLTNLAKPDSNLTGFANFEPSMGGKWLELLKEIAPSTTRAALVFNPKTHSGQYFQLIEAASRRTGIEAIQLPVEDQAQIERAMKSLGQQKDVGMIVMPDNFTFNHRNLIVGLATQHRIPAIYPYRQFVEAGGLLSYGIDLPDLYRRAASYADRMLKDERSADLPVQLPTKFELVVNLKVAKALNFTIPLVMRMTADEVIE
jgi:putative ABC transport system substrate-binding protein